MHDMSDVHFVLGDLDGFYEKNESIEASEEFLWTIHGKYNLISQAKETILSACSEIRLMMPHDDFSELVSAIKTGSSKGVKTLLVIHQLTESVQKLSGSVSTQVYYDKSPLPTNCGMILADDKKGMFISENFNIGFKTSSKSVLMVLSQFYRHEVEESAKI
jgi:sugar-specific transcriptional regulator TrmB